MAVLASRKRKAIRYKSDDGKEYAIATTEGHRVASLGIAPAPNAGGYPRGWTPRHVWGSNTDGSGQKVRLIIGDPTSTLFLAPVGKTFTINDLGTFRCTGAEGEKRPNPAPNAT